MQPECNDSDNAQYWPVIPHKVQRSQVLHKTLLNQCYTENKFMKFSRTYKHFSHDFQGPLTDSNL